LNNAQMCYLASTDRPTDRPTDWKTNRNTNLHSALCRK